MNTVESSSSRLYLILSLATLVATLLLSVSFCVFVLERRAVVWRMLGDFDVDLPAMTRLVHAVPTGAFYVMFAVLAVALVLKEALLRDRAKTLAVNLTAFAYVVLFHEIYTAAIMKPIYHVTTSLT